MQTQFALAAGLAAVYLFVPGYLGFRAAGLARRWSLCAAPILSFATYGVLGVVYRFIHVPANPLTIALLPSAVFLVVALLRSRWGRRSATNRLAARQPSHLGNTSGLALPAMPGAIVLLYVVVGLCVGYFMFVKQLSSPDAVLIGRDVAHHLGGVRTFAESQDFSSFGMSLYQSAGDQAINPMGSGFYPSAWYALCALVVQSGIASVPITINAANYLITSVVWPLGVLVLIRWIVPESRRIAVAGAFTSLAFMAFPWYIIEFGPIYPNLAAFCLVPTCAWTFMYAIVPDLPSRDRLVRLLVFLLSGLGLVLTQTNAVFVVVLLVVPYVCSQILKSEKGFSLFGAHIPRGVVMIAWIVFCVVVWVAINRSPAARDVVTFNLWYYECSIWQALVNVAILSYQWLFIYDQPQPVLAVLVILGIIWTLRNRRLMWYSASYALAVGIIVGNCTQSGVTREIISGFWYSDPPRLAAFAAMIAVPLAAIGVAWVCEGACALFKARGRWGSSIPATVVPAFTIGLVMVIVFYPGIRLPANDYSWWINDETGKLRTKVEDTRLGIASTYSRMGSLVNRKRAFIRYAKRVIDEDGGSNALVVNNPFDGSYLAYGESGIRTYFRDLAVGTKVDDADSTIIRMRLCDVATDPQVQEVVKRIGAKYVLQLEKPHLSPGDSLKWGYDLADWVGIDGITEETPGFEVVTRQGDMVLYRITAVE